MIRNGHSEAYQYSTSFFYTCLGEINTHHLNYIKDTSIAVRGAKSEDFKKWLDNFSKEEHKSKEDLHKSNMAMLDKPL